MLTAGLAIGLAVGAVVATKLRPRLQFPETLLHASATHGASSMALATGPVDQDVEGLFILDFITGELTCSVLNPRNGSIAAGYKVNVVADLGVEQGKQPQYLLVTGKASFRPTGSPLQPAESVVYVADANTGRFVAYWLPWNRQAASQGFPQASPMALLGKGSVRNIQVE